MAIAPSADAYAEQAHPAVIGAPGHRPRRPVREPDLHHAVSRGGRKRSHNPCSTTSTGTASTRTSPAACAGRRHTLAIWDNRCTMHNALNDYSGVRREMFRTSVKGEAPQSAA